MTIDEANDFIRQHAMAGYKSMRDSHRTEVTFINTSENIVMSKSVLKALCLDLLACKHMTQDIDFAETVIDNHIKARFGV